MVFPTTAWSNVRQAGEDDQEALARFTTLYRPALFQFIRGRGFAESDAEDICQDVFVRLLKGRVLAKVHPSKGRLRSLLLAVTVHAIGDFRRRRANQPLQSLAAEPVERDPDFDRQWILQLAAAGLEELRQQGSPYYDVLKDHLAQQSTDRNRLWIARRKLIALIRRQIALTCESHREFEEETAYLSRFLRPAENREID